MVIGIQPPTGEVQLVRHQWPHMRQDAHLRGAPPESPQDHTSIFETAPYRVLSRKEHTGGSQTRMASVSSIHLTGPSGQRRLVMYRTRPGFAPEASSVTHPSLGIWFPASNPAPFPPMSDVPTWCHSVTRPPLVHPSKSAITAHKIPGSDSIYEEASHGCNRSPKTGL